MGAVSTGDTIKADCRKDFFPAYHTSGTRDLEIVLWVVMHVAESPTAEGTARYFETVAAGGSTHLVVDDNVCYRCLPNEAVPWGAQGANRKGFHIEQAGYARWSRDKWVREHDRTLRRAAFKTAYHCHLFGLPTAFRYAKDLKAGRAGVTTHHECVLAFGGDHTCPGVNWPRDVFMKYVRFYYAALEGGT